VKDIDLYQQLLGLASPWNVARVELDVKARRVRVFAEHAKDGRFNCPECGAVCPLHDHDEERSWRHLDSCQFETHLVARVPRVRCDTHGTRQASVPWSQPRSRFTLLFERFAIDVLSATDVLNASKILGISWDQAHHIMERAVERGLACRSLDSVEHIGVDEKSIAKRHKYTTMLHDLDRGVVLEVSQGRSKESLQTCLKSVPTSTLENVKAFAMDMWQPYFDTLCASVTDAASKIVFDRFHIVAHMNKALDLVRRAENRKLLSAGDDRLVGTKYDFLKGAERIDEDTRQWFVRMKNAGFKTARTWSIKELLRGLWDCPSKRQAMRWWKSWHASAVRSRITPVINVARMIKSHLPNVMTYFDHRITNAGSESNNSVVRMLQKRAFGYRSFDNFRTAVLFRCGGLNLYPPT
jgi:transposase